jgi:hypothetical protein
MMGERFSHLKKYKQNNPEEFIEEASESKTSKIAKEHKENILLSISGNISKTEKSPKPFLLYLKKDVEADMKKYCHGNRQAVLNYLIRKGLNKLIEDDELKIVTE